MAWFLSSQRMEIIQIKEKDSLSMQAFFTE